MQTFKPEEFRELRDLMDKSNIPEDERPVRYYNGKFVSIEEFKHVV